MMTVVLSSLDNRELDRETFLVQLLDSNVNPPAMPPTVICRVLGVSARSSLSKL
jgi:hypothetical protein